MTTRRVTVSDSVIARLGHEPTFKENPPGRRFCHKLGRYIDEASQPSSQVTPSAEQQAEADERLENSIDALAKTADKAMRLIDTLREHVQLLEEENQRLSLSAQRYEWIRGRQVLIQSRERGSPEGSAELDRACDQGIRDELIREDRESAN